METKQQITAEEAEYLASKGMTTRFDENGNPFISNRAARRKRPVTDSKYTKSTHSQKLKKLGKKKARK
jgi:hypothetical protein